MPCCARVRLAAAAVTALLLLPDFVKSSPGPIIGAGATFPVEVYEWAAFSYKFIEPGVDFTYDPTGSGTGQKRIKARAVDFAGSDALLTEDDYAQYPGLQMYPVLAGMIVPILGPLPGLSQVPGVPAPGVSSTDGVDASTAIVLSREALAGIFRGTVRVWNDSAITSTNPHLNIPALPIAPIVRADGSGTSEIFKRSLVSFSDGFASDIGCGPPAVCSVSVLKGNRWPAGIDATRNNASGSSGVIGLTILTPGSISYTSLAGAEAAGVTIARMQNRAGTAVSATVSSLDAALFEKGGNLDARFNAEVHDAFSALAWPICGYTYLIWNTPASGMRVNSTCEDRRRALQFWEWMYTSPIAAAGASAFRFSVLPSFLRQRIVTEMRQSILCEDGPALGTSTTSGLLGTGSLVTNAAMTLFTSAYQAVVPDLPVTYAGDSAIAVSSPSAFTTPALIAGSSDFVVTLQHPLLEASAVGAFPPQQLRQAATTHTVPLAIAPLSIVHRVSGVSALRFSIDALVRIFLTGEATHWNDTAIAAANPGVALPSTPIRASIPDDSPEPGFILGAALSRFSASARATILELAGVQGTVAFQAGAAPLADVWASSVERLSTAAIAAELKLVDNTISVLTARSSFPAPLGHIVLTRDDIAAASSSATSTSVSSPGMAVSTVTVETCTANPPDPSYVGTALEGAIVIQAGLESNAECASALQQSSANALDAQAGAVLLERVPVCSCWPMSVPVYITMARNFSSAVDEAAASQAAASGVAVVPKPQGGCLRGDAQLSFVRWMLSSDSVVQPLADFNLSPLPAQPRADVSTSAGEAVTCDGEAIQPAGCRVGQQAVAGSDICVSCPAGSYSLDTSGVCKPCPIGGECPGGSVIVADQGYWQLDQDVTQLFKCSTGECCPAGGCSLESSGRCGRGYSDASVMCARCDEAAGFAYSLGGCAECPSVSAPLVVAMLVIGLVFNVLMMQGDARAWVFKLFTDFAQLAVVAGAAVASEASVRWIRAFALDVASMFGTQPPCVWPASPLGDSFFSVILLGVVLGEAALMFLLEVIVRKTRAYFAAWASDDVQLMRRAGMSGCQIRQQICLAGCSCAIDIGPAEDTSPDTAVRYAPSSTSAHGGAAVPFSSSSHGHTAASPPASVDAARQFQMLKARMRIGSKWMFRYVTLLWRLLFISYSAIVKAGLRLLDCQQVGDVSIVRSRNGIECGTPQHIVASIAMTVVVVIISVILPVIHCRTMRAELGPRFRFGGVSLVVKRFLGVLDCLLCRRQQTSKKSARPGRGGDAGTIRRRRWSIVDLHSPSVRNLQFELGGWVHPEQRIWFESWFFIRKTLLAALEVLIADDVVQSLVVLIAVLGMLSVLLSARPIASASASVVMNTYSVALVALAGINIGMRVYQLFQPEAPIWMLVVGVTIFFIPIVQFVFIFVAILLGGRVRALRSIVTITSRGSSVAAPSVIEAGGTLNDDTESDSDMQEPADDEGGRMRVSRQAWAAQRPASREHLRADPLASQPTPNDKAARNA